MATMNISLPESLKTFVEAQIIQSDFSNASDYVRTLIREDKEQREKYQMLKTAINEGIKDIEKGRTYTAEEARQSLIKHING